MFGTPALTSLFTGETIPQAEAALEAVEGVVGLEHLGGGEHGDVGQLEEHHVHPEQPLEGY